MTTYNNNYEQSVPFSDTCQTFNLTSGGGNQTYTVPGTAADKYTMMLNYISTSNVFVCLNETAVIPGAHSFDTTAYNEFRPGEGNVTKRYVKGGDVVNLITPDASAYVGLRLMKLPG